MLRIKNSLAVVLLCLICIPSISGAGAPMPSAINSNHQKLILNGTGVRNKFSIDLFTGGLYLKQKSKDAEKIILADELMSFKLEVTSDLITGKRLEKNMRSEFERVTNGQIAPYADRIEVLVRALRENLQKGDVFDLVYEPHAGLNIYKNKKLKASIEGLDFKRMLFTIWLGADPADENLKKGMLGY